MPIRKTTKLEVAQRLESLLIQTLPLFDDRIYWTMGSQPPGEANIDTELVTFCFQDGSFDYSGSVGGYTDYNGTVRISFWRTNHSSEVGSDKQMLLDSPLGLYSVQQAMMRITGQDLDDGDPTDAILLHGLKPVSDSEAKESHHQDAYNQEFSAVLHVEFALDFQWDTSAPDVGDPFSVSPSAPDQTHV